jgi:hypothetical protein
MATLIIARQLRSPPFSGFPYISCYSDFHAWCSGVQNKHVIYPLKRSDSRLPFEENIIYAVNEQYNHLSLDLLRIHVFAMRLPHEILSPLPDRTTVFSQQLALSHKQIRTYHSMPSDSTMMSPILTRTSSTLPKVTLGLNGLARGSSSSSLRKSSVRLLKEVNDYCEERASASYTKLRSPLVVSVLLLEDYFTADLSGKAFVLASIFPSDLSFNLAIVVQLVW